MQAARRSAVALPSYDACTTRGTCEAPEQFGQYKLQTAKMASAATVPSPPRQRASTGKAAARASQSEVESMPPPAANHLPPDVFFSDAALLAELGPGAAQSAPAQMKRFGRFMTPYSSDRAQ